MAKANSTFHSSGTAIGNVERMKRWNTTMPITASSVTVGLVETSSTRGSTISTVVPPMWASRPAAWEGRRSSGKLR